MKRTLPALLLLAAVGVAIASAAVSGRQDNLPGQPTTARMFILNRTAAEAVPVAVHSTGDAIPVTVMGTPTATLAANTVVGVHVSRQTWEYRQVRVAGTQDVESSLNAAGAEGWEAVSSTSLAGSTTFLLKRPR